MADDNSTTPPAGTPPAAPPAAPTPAPVPLVTSGIVHVKRDGKIVAAKPGTPVSKLGLSSDEIERLRAQGFIRPLTADELMALSAKKK